MEVWFQMLSSFGFPIVCCVALALYVQKKIDKYFEENKGVIDRNTEAFIKLFTLLNSFIKEDNKND